MMKSLRNSIASVAMTHFPGALAFIADAGARGKVSVKTTREHIDIIRKEDGATIRLARASAIYLPDMISCFDYYFASVIPPASAPNLVDFSQSRLHHVRGFDDFEIMCPSTTEPFVTTQQYLDFASLTEGHVVLDLGAYSALTSIAFSKQVGRTGRVISVEPDPRNFEAAAVNIARHSAVSGLTNIKLISAAVSGRTGAMCFSGEGAMGSADVSLVGDYRGSAVQVQTFTLSDLARNEHCDRVDFVKMDIEGSEEAVVRSSAAFLKEYRPKLVIEVHKVKGVLSLSGVRAALETFGYSCRVVEQTGISLPLVLATPIAAELKAAA